MALASLLWTPAALSEMASLTIAPSSYVDPVILQQQLSNQPELADITTGVLMSRSNSWHDEKLTQTDIVDLSWADAVEGCDRDLLHPLRTDKLPAPLSLSTIREDYPANALLPCAIGHTVSSQIIIASQAQMHGLPAPAIGADLFDIDTYPGQRALQPSPRYLAERALLASGIASDSIYSTLAYPARAWPIIESALNSLRNRIVWVANDQQAINAVSEGRASFAMVGSHSLLSSAATDAANSWMPIWHQALQEIRFWAIPRSTDHFNAAWSVLSTLSQPVVNGRYSTARGHAPARLSALQLVAMRHRSLLATDADNRHGAVLTHSSWWRNHGTIYQQLFADWLARNEPYRDRSKPSRDHTTPLMQVAQGHQPRQSIPHPAPGASARHASGLAGHN